MNDFKILKCPSCGASLVETQSESILSCSHCGTKLVSQNTQKENSLKQLKSDNSLIKKLLVVVISLIIVISGVIFWSSNKSIEQKDLVDNLAISEKNNSHHNTNKLINAPLSNMPKLNTQAMGVNKQSLENKSETVKKPSISIVSQVAGETTIGGKYWIVTVQNDSLSQVVRPRVVMSLFDENKRRIGEHVGWSKLDTLEAGSEATILVLISEPPKVAFTTETQAMAAFANKLGSNVIHVKVDDFIVTPKPNSDTNVTIVGDVSNPHDFRVDFIRVQAIARNTKGIAIGMADAFVTNSSLASREISGFKITASTFITEPAATWSLWASGRKHRGK